MINGDGNVICDYSGNVASLPAGKYMEVGVYREPTENNCMHLTHYVGPVNPPFSAVPALPPFVRQSIATLTPKQIASLRKGIQVMMSRPATDPTSYRFQANIHATNDSPTTPQETQAWNQCEHGSFYFFSWHRMYLYFFERILRTASGDPNLALPYWKWDDPAQRALPMAFREPSDASNPLYLPPPDDRPAALDNGSAQLADGTVSFKDAFKYANFLSPSGSGLSFGGQEVAPGHFNSPHGQLESQPHDVVHDALGGLMQDPYTSSLDPIFYLHHAQIDRLWKRWLDQGTGQQDPLSDSAWMNTTFQFFDETGHAVSLTGSQIIDTVGQLNYRYDDDPMVMGQSHPVPIERPTPLQATPVIEARNPLATSQTTAPGARIKLSNAPVTVSLPLSEAADTELRAMAAPNAEHKIILQLDALQKEKSEGIYYEVYVNLAQGETPNFHSPNFVGTLSFFGLKPHPEGHGDRGGPQNFTRDYDISNSVRALSAGGTWNSKEMSITLVPRGLVGRNGEPLPMSPEIAGTFGKITLSAE
ncbi:MAG: tyrosinase family protein [Methylocella sp.]